MARPSLGRRPGTRGAALLPFIGLAFPTTGVTDWQRRLMGRVNDKPSARAAPVVRSPSAEHGTCGRGVAQPRTFDPLHPGSHFVHFYDDLPDKEYREAVGRLAQAVRHYIIPPRMQDVWFRVLTDSFWMGERLQAKNRSHCERGSCAHAANEYKETIQHAFCDCPSGASELWE